MTVQTLAENIFVVIWENIRDKYLTMEMGNYDNFSFNEHSIITPTLVIVGITIGIIIGGLFVLRDKRILGSFVRALLMDQCYTPETAKTLAELGFENNYFVRMHLKKGRILGRVVHCAEAEIFEAEVAAKKEAYEKENEGKENVPPFVSAPFQGEQGKLHYYIPKEESYEADVRFEKKGTSIGAYIALVVGSLVIMGLLIYLFPDAIQLMDNAINLIKG